MPLGKFKNFKACKAAMTRKLGSVEKANKYCGKLYWSVHGKKEGTKKLKHDLEELKKQINGVLNDK